MTPESPTPARLTPARAPKRWLRWAAPLTVVALLGAACGSDDDDESDTAADPSEETTDDMAAAVTTTTGASALRAGLTDLLTEHVYLAAEATGAALRGDDAAFTAFATALNGPSNSNTADLTAAITSAYGADVGKAFDGLWRSEAHIPAFVAYTKAIAAGDQAGADKAVADALGYAKTFGTTINSVNSNLPAAAVEAEVTMHITTLKAVIDAQKAGDPTATYAALRTAYHHMDMTALALAGGTVAKFPDKFDGEADSKAATLRAGMTSLLREHVFLATSATGAALRGDTPGFMAAAAALNGPSGSNTVDIVAAITSAYGDDVGKAFDGLWRSEGHIPAVVAYTQAIAAGDDAKASQAITDILAYAATFGGTLNSVNSNLGSAAVEEAIKGHATTLKAVIDAQKAGNPTEAVALLREAVHHMSGTADVLAEATVKLFEDDFR